MTRLITSAVAGTLIVLLTLTFGVSAFTNGTPGCLSAAPPSSQPPGVPQERSSPVWDTQQLTNARTILAVGTQMNVPPRGQVIALATAIQESSLRNLPGGDADSLGLFQQRPSAGWGTPAQILNPSYATARFYQALLATPDWRAMPLTQAAQNVQHSAHPLAYADDEAAATSLYALTHTQTTPARPAHGTAATPSTCNDTATTVLPPDRALPGGTSATVKTAIAWALQQLGTPYSYGGDCTAAHSGDPARRCDCSSLVQRAYAAAARVLPRTSQEQFHVGTPVPTDHLEPGDLIFTAGADGTPTAPGHVALYLGNTKIIEAPYTGSEVRVATLTSARLSDIVGARRIVPVIPEPSTMPSTTRSNRQ